MTAGHYEPCEERVFRVRNWYRNLGIFGVIFFPTILVTMVWLAFEEPLNDPARRAVFMPLLCVALPIYVAMGLLSLWHLLVFSHEQLTIDGSRVVDQRVFQTSAFDLKDVTELHWRYLPRSGRIVVRSSAGTVTIRLKTFTIDERLQLIEYFREGVRKGTQQNWDAFCFHVAMPLRWRSRSPGDLTDEDVRLARKRRDIHGATMILAAAIAGVAGVIVLEKSWWLLGLPVPLVLLWLSTRALPIKPVHSRRMEDYEFRMGMLVVAWLLIGAVGFTCIEGLRAPYPLSKVLEISGTLIWWGGVFLGATRMDRHRKAIVAEEIESAVRQWESAAKAESS